MFRLRPPSVRSSLVCALTLLALAGCDAGGDGAGDPGGAVDQGDLANASDLPVKPTLAVTAGVKQLRFTWGAAAGATSYRFYEDAGTGTGFTQLAEGITGTAYNLNVSVHRLRWATARFRVDACNDAGCNASDPIGASDQMLAAIGYFKASNTGAGDTFGGAVALSADGKTLAVSARGEDSRARRIGGNQANDYATDAGAVYVFARKSGAWTQQAYIKGSDIAAYSAFGIALALSADGNTLAVGAWGQDSYAGAAYVFVRSGDTWSQQSEVTAPNRTTSDGFGYAVALSPDGDTLAVGAYGKKYCTGAAYVFVRADGAWAWQATLRASNPEAYDMFGGAVALANDTLAVGASHEGSGTKGIDTTPDEKAPQSGAVYVFTRSGTSWAQQAYIKASNTGPSDMFGSTVALSGDGNKLVAGAPHEASNAVGVGGSQTNDDAETAGAVYVFTRTAGFWSQRAYLKASNTGADDDFGRAIALSRDGTTLAVGAIGEDSAAAGVGGDQSSNAADWAGAVYVFRDSGTAWSQKAYVKASNTGIGDGFGLAVALNEDGSTLAVSASDEQGSATGVDGEFDDSMDRAGAVYLY